MHDIDDLVADDEEETVLKGPVKPKSEDIDIYVKDDRQPVGEVEHFFSNISVAAIHLSGELKVGDTIEIGEGSDKVRLGVSSMQIDRKEVDSAGSGDSVGIKIDYQVTPGSKVYLV